MIARYLIIIAFLGLTLQLSACGSHTYHVVKPGETLFMIGWAYGHDYKQIAAWNDIDAPFSISSGQKIKLVPPEVSSNSSKVLDVSVKANRKNRSGYKGKIKNHANISANSRDNTDYNAHNNNHANKIAWKWPTISKNIIQYFSASDIRKKGVNIAGRNGQSINAAAAGRVVYSGSGLIGYGRLIIIKHEGAFLSAYAHNRELLVKEGDEITRGQRIATMGSSGTDRVMLHFEIRRKGIPVDPLNFLPRKG